MPPEYFMTDDAAFYFLEIIKDTEKSP